MIEILSINTETDLRVPNNVLMFGRKSPESLAITTKQEKREKETNKHQQMMMTANQINASTPAEEVMQWIYQSLSNGIRSGRAKKPMEWLKERGLSVTRSGACFNSGQLHHRKPQSFKEALAKTGFLQRSQVPTNGEQIPYTVFGNYSVLFPLKDEKGHLVNFYATSLKKTTTAFMNEKGIYPHYPPAHTQRLYVTKDIPDAAAVLESQALDSREAVIALFDGKVMPQHQTLIQSMDGLQEIVFVNTKPDHP